MIQSVKSLIFLVFQTFPPSRAKSGQAITKFQCNIRVKALKERSRTLEIKLLLFLQKVSLPQRLSVATTRV